MEKKTQVKTMNITTRFSLLLNCQAGIS